MSDHFSVLNANIGSMYLYSIKNVLPPALGDLYGSIFNHGRAPSKGLESFAQLIYHHNPTVVCLQEVYGATPQKPAQFEELFNKLNPLYRFFSTDVGGENKVILVQNEVVNGHRAEKIITSLHILKILSFRTLYRIFVYTKGVNKFGF